MCINSVYLREQRIFWDSIRVIFIKNVQRLNNQDREKIRKRILYSNIELSVYK